MQILTLRIAIILSLEFADCQLLILTSNEKNTLKFNLN